MTQKVRGAQPTIPRPPAKLDPELSRFLETVVQSIETWQGRRADPLDRVITLRDLQDPQFRKSIGLE